MLNFVGAQDIEPLQNSTSNFFKIYAGSRMLLEMMVLPNEIVDINFKTQS